MLEEGESLKSTQAGKSYRRDSGKLVVETPYLDQYFVATHYSSPFLKP